MFVLRTHTLVPEDDAIGISEYQYQEPSPSCAKYFAHVGASFHLGLMFVVFPVSPPLIKAPANYSEVSV